jgi:hypothetical protein
MQLKTISEQSQETGKLSAWQMEYLTIGHCCATTFHFNCMSPAQAGKFTEDNEGNGENERRRPMRKVGFSFPSLAPLKKIRPAKAEVAARPRPP